MYVWAKVAQLRINILIGILGKLSRRRYMKFKLQIHLREFRYRYSQSYRYRYIDTYYRYSYNCASSRTFVIYNIFMLLTAPRPDLVSCPGPWHIEGVAQSETIR